MKNKKCPENAVGCLKYFTPRTKLQVCCSNINCKKQRRQRNAKEWVKNNKDYMENYRNSYKLL